MCTRSTPSASSARPTNAAWAATICGKPGATARPNPGASHATARRWSPTAASSGSQSALEPGLPCRNTTASRASGGPASRSGVRTSPARSSDRRTWPSMNGRLAISECAPVAARANGWPPITKRVSIRAAQVGAPAATSAAPKPGSSASRHSWPWGSSACACRPWGTALRPSSPVGSASRSITVTCS